MYIAKNNDLIVLVNDSREVLEQQLQFMQYTSIEETEIQYELYNGQYLTPEEIAAKERERIDGLIITKDKFLLGVYNKTQTTPEQIEDMLSSMTDVLISFKYAVVFRRADSIVCALCRLLKISKEDMDNIFQS